MAIFVIPVALKAAATFIGANGARAAAKKYGPKVIKEAQEAMAKRQASIAAKTQGAKTGKYATDAMVEAGKKAGIRETRMQKGLASQRKRQEGVDAFKQLDGKLKPMSKGGSPRYGYVGGGKVEMHKCKPN